MFNLESLNDYEFELLCKDIMEKVLQMELYTFPKGPDGGIDICDKNIKPIYMIQVKHYYKSSYSALKSQMKKEIVKVEEKAPKHYYVCTSQGLTKNNKNEIYNLFSDYMEDTSNIIDQVYINDFLSKEENQEIVTKNFKLWLSASNVLSLIFNQKIFIDCDELLIDIENNSKYFVETTAYREALRKLNEERIIIIIGGPGVGKSTLSKMLILKYSADKYTVRYSTDNEIGNIKQSLSLNPQKKEIVLLDDFLGQHYLKIKDDKPNQIKTLISFVKRNPNKKIILNSRITIINEAKEHFILFKELIETYENNTYLINLDKMEEVEKAKILYNHIYFNGLPREHFLSIKKDKGYFRIIRHRNYNPRIIEYVTKERIYKSIPADEYFQYIIKKLDEPADVWKDEFYNRLTETDRILMYTLYSLTNKSIEKDILEVCYNKRIREERYDTSINVFKNSILRLTNSIIVIIDEHDKLKISTINPSVNDYIHTELNENKNEQLKIIKGAVYIEQIIKISNSDEANEYIKSQVISGEILRLKTLEKSIFFYYIKLVDKYEIKEKGIEDKVKLSFERIYEGIKESDQSEYGRLINKLIYSDFIKYYDLENIFTDSDKIRILFNDIPLEDLKEILEELIYIKIIRDDSEIKIVLEEIIIDKITNVARERVDTDLGTIISSTMSDIEKSDIRAYQNGYTHYVESCAWDAVEAALYDEINNELSEFNGLVNLTIKDFDVDENKWHFDLNNEIDSCLASEPDYYDDEWHEKSSKSDSNIIIDMFER